MGVSVCGGCNPSIVVIRWTAGVWEWSSSSNQQITESQPLLGWKRPPRPLRASINPPLPKPPPTPVPQGHIHRGFEHLQGWSMAVLVVEPPSRREGAFKTRTNPFLASGTAWRWWLQLQPQFEEFTAADSGHEMGAVVAVTSSWWHRWHHQDADGSFATWGLRVHSAQRLQSPLYRCFTHLPGDVGKAALETDILR